MAGIILTRYDGLSSVRRVEAVKKRSKAEGRPAKAQRSKALKLKRHAVPKAATGLSSAMQPIADWLGKLGMSEYAEQFAENGIDLGVLPDLTDQDLKDIGVLLGHRRKLLRAIAELTGLEKGALRPAISTAAPVASHDTAERRQVTVMFSDLVGSTALAARMDPEDLREVISAYQKCVAETVKRFGGYVAKYMGDGVLVYFGYPQAHEDDAERAVRAGLELITAVSALKSESPLQTRVGIATGLVVVGDLIGAGEAQERGIVGETPNLAARLQGVAEPNSVVIAESTRRLLGNLFDLEDLGAKDLKGINEPVRTWAVLRACSVASRFEALHAAGLTALVGREEELELLQRRWSKTKSGEGQVVLLSGEAGIGKSRLTAALMESIASEPHTRLRYFCSPHHTDSALYPIIGQMERAAGFAHDDALEAKLKKLDAVLSQTSTSKQDAALLADMLSLTNDGRYPALDLAPEQRRQRTLQALLAQMEALSRQNPVLMIFEDAHWSDPTSLEVYGRVIDRIASLRVLLLVTFRPEFGPPWIGQPHVTALTLNRLPKRDIDAMIDGVVGNKLLPASIRQDIIERTDGIPLFVEEMTKAVLEAESEGEARRTAAAIPGPASAVPASLQASLMARLDRLGPAKEIAQIGAAIGREFSHALLAATVRKPQGELQSALDRLIQYGLLFRQGAPPHATYLFKHALIQDAAYGTLLREPRRALHARIAETIERRFPEIAENQPELLARHCTEAGLIEKAASLWGKAGQRSLRRSAVAEAVEQLRRALAQIATLPGTLALRREEVKLQVALIGPLIHVKGHAAPETKAAAERAQKLLEKAEALGEPPEDPLLLFSVLYNLWGANFSNFEAARDLAAQFLTFAERQRSTTPRMIGHRMMGTSLIWLGRISEGMVHLDQALKLYEPAAHRALGPRFGQDIRVSILYYRSFALWTLGYPDAALDDAKRAVDDAREIGQDGTLMAVLHFTSVMYILLYGNYDIAKAQIAEMVTLADKTGAGLWRLLAAPMRGALLVRMCQYSDAVQTINSARAETGAMGITATEPQALSDLATAYAALGRFDEANRCIGEAFATLEENKQRWGEAEVDRVAGEIALKSPEHDVSKAQSYFERSLAIARNQQAKSWELRATMSMARLWRDQGKRDEARELLAPVYGWFTEGFDTRDLKEAKELLDELAA
jgi:class 3 adenylate cyclase/predicted ATPase